MVTNFHIKQEECWWPPPVVTNLQTNYREMLVTTTCGRQLAYKARRMLMMAAGGHQLFYRARQMLVTTTCGHQLTYNSNKKQVITWLPPLKVGTQIRVFRNFYLLGSFNHLKYMGLSVNELFQLHFFFNFKHGPIPNDALNVNIFSFWHIYFFELCWYLPPVLRSNIFYHLPIFELFYDFFYRARHLTCSQYNFNPQTWWFSG